MTIVYTNVSAGRLHLTSGETRPDGSCIAKRCAIEVRRGLYACGNDASPMSGRAVLFACGLDEAARYVATGHRP